MCDFIISECGWIAWITSGPFEDFLCVKFWGIVLLASNVSGSHSFGQFKFEIFRTKGGQTYEIIKLWDDKKVVNLICQTQPEGLAIQMKALDEYIVIAQLSVL